LVLSDKRGYHFTLYGKYPTVNYSFLFTPLLGHRSFVIKYGGFFVAGWVFHYFPFFAMKRQLFLHHYFPALYMSMLLSCVFAEVVFRKMTSSLRFIALMTMIVAIIGVYWMYAPWTYGFEVSHGFCEQIKLHRSWRWHCPARIVGDVVTD
jgi:dolichyl-phosphate-mannose--protein O-mannosyl transferase